MQRFHSFALRLALAPLALFAFTAVCAAQTPSAAPPLPKPVKAVILPFALATHAADTPGFSGQACPALSDPPLNPPLVLDDSYAPKLVPAIAAEMQKKLSKKMTAAVGAPGEILTPGTLVFAGCITVIDPGNAAERMAGMGLGASHVAAHIIVHLQTPDGLIVVKEYDAEAKGSMILPPMGPIGVATHAARERKETLNAVAQHMADEALKTFNEKPKK